MGRKRTKNPLPEIVHKKLGRSKAYGQCYADENLIEIDSRLTGKTHLNTLIHESLHAANPDWSETKVNTLAYFLAEILWAQNYREVLMK